MAMGAAHYHTVAPARRAAQTQLAADGDARVRAPLARRERAAAIVSAAGFVLAAGALAALAPTEQTLSLAGAAAFLLAFAVCSRIEFEVWSGAAVPTQLVLVPMLFALPPPYVPLVVAAGYALGEAPRAFRGHAHPTRMLLAGANAWHALGPALVFTLAGVGSPSLRDWPVYAGALAAQLALDFGITTAYEAAAFASAPRAMLRPLGVVYLIDLALSPVALLAAFPIASRPTAILLVVPLAALLAFFARERSARLEGDAQLVRAQSDALSLALQRTEAEARLSKVEAEYRDLVERLPLATYVADVAETPTLRYISPQIEPMLGYPPHTFQERPGLWSEIVHDDDRADVVGAWRAWARRGGAFRAEYRVLSSSGDERWLLDQATSEDAGEDGAGRARGFLLDITERKRLEEELLDSRRLEAVGRLAGGIAHDFNNLLTAIVGAGEFMLDALPEGHRCRQDATDVLSAADRASRLVAQLLAFSRSQVLTPAVLDLNEVVHGMSTILARLVGEAVELTTHLEPSLGAVRADRTQLEQVIVNLVVNARDAMPVGGRIAIRTTNVERPEVPGGLGPGRHVALSVGDTGLGMDGDTAARAFEPFFTTKEPGKGTGLGLATSHGIVAQSGGSMSVTSAPGVGTTVTIYLPVIAGSPADAGEAPQGPTAASSRVILVVEDTSSVRTMIQRMLEQLGYTVLAAEDGPAALALVREHRGPIDLVLTDVVMTGMSGRILAGQLERLRPGIAVLFMSGYTGSETGEFDGRFIQKPFTRDALGARIHELLTAAAQSPAEAPAPLSR